MRVLILNSSLIFAFTLKITAVRALCSGPDIYFSGPQKTAGPELRVRGLESSEQKAKVYEAMQSEFEKAGVIRITEQAVNTFSKMKKNAVKNKVEKRAK